MARARPVWRTHDKRRYPVTSRIGYKKRASAVECVIVEALPDPEADPRPTRHIGGLLAS